MHRSLTTKALAIFMIALFHVAMFEDVVMLLCAPQPGVEQVAMAPSHGSDHASMAGMAGMAGHEHHGATPTGSDSQDPAPHHDHGTCDFCCSHGPADVGRLPTLQASLEVPAIDVPPAEFAELHLSAAPHLNTLPNPPPVA